jgi:hypothetical protein
MSGIKASKYFLSTTKQKTRYPVTCHKRTRVSQSVVSKQRPKRRREREKEREKEKEREYVKVRGFHAHIESLPHQRLIAGDSN